MLGNDIKERAERYQAAAATVAMAESAAWREMIAYLQGEVDRAKGEAILADVTESSKIARRRLIAWQEREKIVIALESRVDDARRDLAAMDEEDRDERARERDRASRGGW